MDGPTWSPREKVPVVIAEHHTVSMGASSEVVIRALNKARPKAGDLVSISLSPGAVVKGAAVLYLIPPAGLMLGILRGAGLNLRLPISQMGAVTASGFADPLRGFIVTALISRWMSPHNRLAPVITRIIKPRAQAPGSFTPIDPVCKMAVNSNQTAPGFTHRGRTYCYFAALSVEKRLSKRLKNFSKKMGPPIKRPYYCRSESGPEW